MEKVYCKNCKWYGHGWGDVCVYYHPEINRKFMEIGGSKSPNEEHYNKKKVYKTMKEDGLNPSDRKQFPSFGHIRAMDDCPLNKNNDCKYYEIHKSMFRRYV